MYLPETLVPTDRAPVVRVCFLKILCKTLTHRSISFLPTEYLMSAATKKKIKKCVATVLVILNKHHLNALRHISNRMENSKRFFSKDGKTLKMLVI